MLSIIVFAITPSSFANGSNCAVPSSLTPFAPFNFLIKSFDLSPSENTLQVIVLLPSYKSNITSTFPLFNSLESIFKISPSNCTLPLSTLKSATFTNCSFNFRLLPNISGDSSAGFSCGTSIDTLIS